MSDSELSPAGQQRREQILALAMRLARRRARQRRIWRSAAVVAAMLLASVAARQLIPRQPAPVIVKIQPVRPPPSTSPLPAPAAPPEVIITEIQTDPTLVDRLAARGDDIPIRYLDDDEFLKALADANQPAGLARFNGKTILLPR